MRWFDRLYVGDGAEKTQDRIVRGIRKGKVQWNVYVLTMPSNPANQLDILSSNYLLQPYCKRQEDLTVVGIAKGREEAFFVLQQMVEDAMKEYGTPDLRRLFSSGRYAQEGADV